MASPGQDLRSLSRILVLLLLWVASTWLIFLRLGDIEMPRYDESLYALRSKGMYLSGHLMTPMQGRKVA